MLPCLYDLDLFSLNTDLDCNLNPANQSFVRVLSLTNGRGSWVVGRGYKSWVVGVVVGVGVSNITN